MLTAETRDRLRAAGDLLGVEIVDSTTRSEAPDIAEVLVPGARICFTGTALDDNGNEVERAEMMRIASAAGLAPVKSVTKTRCEVLVTAEAGTQSGKANKARELGKPVFAAQEFLQWARDHSSSPDTP